MGWLEEYDAGYVLAYADAAIDELILKAKPFYDDLPWLFALTPWSVPSRVGTNHENTE